MYRKKHLLLLGPTDDYLKKAQQCDIEITILTEASRVSYFQQNSVQTVLLSQFSNYSDLLLTVLDANTNKPFDFVISFTEYGMEPAALIASILNIPGPSLHSTLICRDKYRTRQAIEPTIENKVYYAKAESNNIVDAFIEQYGLPVVLKPRNETGSCNVKIISDIHEVPLNLGDGLIVETFAPGKEYSCETFSLNGQHNLISVTEKVLGGDSGVVEVGHRIFSESKLTPLLQSWAFNVLNSLGITDGVGHIEVKVEQNELYLIECHNRPGGDRIWQLVELATGFDMITACIRLYSGEHVIKPVNINRNAAIVFFQFPEGTITKCKHPFDKPPKWIKWHDWKVRKGDEITPIIDSFSRYGGMIIDASTPEKLERRIDKTLSLIEVY